MAPTPTSPKSIFQKKVKINLPYSTPPRLSLHSQPNPSCCGSKQGGETSVSNLAYKGVWSLLTDGAIFICQHGSDAIVSSGK